MGPAKCGGAAARHVAGLAARPQLLSGNCTSPRGETEPDNIKQQRSRAPINDTWALVSETRSEPATSSEAYSKQHEQRNRPRSRSTDVPGPGGPGHQKNGLILRYQTENRLSLSMHRGIIDHKSIHSAYSKCILPTFVVYKSFSTDNVYIRQTA